MTILTNPDPLPFQEAREVIRRELHSDDAEVRAEFLSHFAAELEEFATLMARAIDAWRSLDQPSGERERAYVTGLANLAIYLQVDSMKLFITGHTIAAGNVFRQVLEAMALTLLCSGGSRFTFLRDFIGGTYKSHRAIFDLVKHAQALQIKPDALEAVLQSQKFYHLYSHPTLLSLAIPMVTGGEGSYVGANFDPGKIAQYRQEMAGRLGLAGIFVSFIEGVKANMRLWPATSAEASQPVAPDDSALLRSDPASKVEAASALESSPPRSGLTRSRRTLKGRKRGGGGGG